MNRPTLKRTLVGFLLSFVVTILPVQASPHDHWVATWSAPPDSEGPSLGGQTVRQIIRTSVGGSSVRIRVSNLIGKAPVTLGPIHLARHASGPSIQPGTDRLVTFGGRRTVTIASKASVLSDPIVLPVGALERLAVSLYVPGRGGPSTIHATGIDTAYIASGNATMALQFPTSKTDSSRYFLTDIEVSAHAGTHALVIVGDSITDGVGSTPDRHTRWPDVLAQRLQAHPKLASVAVVNSGIAGNRILNDDGDPFVGPSILSRFDRDALSKPGVRWVLLFAGINDISAAGVFTTPKDQVSARQIIEGMRMLTARARSKGIKVWGATLTPLEGVEPPYYSAAGEAKRQAVNTWIRASGEFDAIIDFDQTIRDPAHATRMLPAFDSGDHLHPNDAGYEAMAESIDLRLFR